MQEGGNSEENSLETTKAETPDATGPKTTKGGSTYQGPAKPDDPVYKEGWTITVGGLQGRSSPSGSTPPT